MIVEQCYQNSSLKNKQKNNFYLILIFESFIVCWNFQHYKSINAKFQT